jgi:hypothetical protein
VASLLVVGNFAKVVWINSLKPLNKSWEFSKGLGFVTVHFSQYSLDCAVGWHVTNLVVE